MLACIAGIIAAVLLVGGAQLVLLGGSPYYVLAGLLIAVSAYFCFRGDWRGIWTYGALLLITLAWALWEGGGNFWALQARLFAPLVLGIWVAWPIIRQLGRSRLFAGGALLVMLPVFTLVYVNRTERVDVATLPAVATTGDWPVYGHDQGGSRFSDLTQINTANVAQLKPAWEYQTGVDRSELGFEVTPLMVNDSLYLCTSNNVIIALAPETGQQKWRFDPKVDSPPLAACRGVAYYEVPQSAGAKTACHKRIIFATTDARLMAVDSETGRLCAAFGANGTVDLKSGMGEIKSGYYYVSSAPTIIRGRVILGGWVRDNQELGEPSGVIRAFDATTGAFSWAWDMDHPDNPNEPTAGQTYSRGTANSWAPMSADENLGMVYVPTGNATPDYWGGSRSPGSEKYSSAVVALDAETGRVRWAFQTTHHDLWDYDVASQPTLVDLDLNGRKVPALIQATKRAELFVLDRRTGKPLVPVQERPVPQGAAAGDWTAPTQPFSTGDFSLDKIILSEAQMWGATPLDQLWCRIKFREARYDGPMTPPGLKPTITYPSYSGGVNWGSVSIDPVRQLMVVNWIRVANYTRLFTREEANRRGVSATADGHVTVDALLPQGGTPFAAQTAAFLSPLNIPCTQPPFGMIAAFDLGTNKMIWKRTLGTTADSGPFYTASHVPLPMGVPNMGGSLLTRAGLIFIGATQERKIRAFQSATGKLLWTYELPRSGHATPMTYLSRKNGRQYVVIAAGGNVAMGSPSGNYIVAFALPNNGSEK
ncbi:MAG: membrane-bound PQQ-dependent dehydrogenase, glucose/quinate/shikimate family [Planctomycetales bacterium]|nr:membrane-bound PQQ-dependent dehydrogenase, glucose/quinate/shikimate family [Planctomycetales bacterium]